jgi:hypothetical protein
MSRLLKTCLVFCLIAVFPALAQADVQTLDFDSAPLGVAFDGAGDISFPRALGFRPYPTEVGTRAQSGTSVGDIGRCLQEAPDEAGGCEFFRAQTTAQLARTAKKVTVFAGQFGPVDPSAPPERAILTVFRADGSRIGEPITAFVDARSFRTELSFLSLTGEIAKFTVRAANGGDLGIDAVAVDFDTGAPADFSISTTAQVVPLVQGQHFDVPVSLPRVNGSNGPILLQVGNLPVGVEATVLPEDPIRDTQSSATLRLTPTASAIETGVASVDATILATPFPANNTNVGPAARTAPISIRIARDFGLSSGGLSDATVEPGDAVPVAAPECAPVDVPLKLSRDIAMTQDVSLQVGETALAGSPLPPGVSAEFLPSPVVAPGGDLVAERTLRFRVGPEVEFGKAMPLVLAGRTASNARELPIRLFSANPTASIATDTPGSGLGETPRFGRLGTRVRVHGSGFCPGTTVEVGNENATAPATLVDDHTIEFTVPRLATTARVTIVPPGNLPRYKTEDRLVVDSVRNSDGFPFVNPGFGSLSLGELTEAFGSEDLFVNINPCWPFGSCRVTTGILNPVAAIDWGIINVAARAGGGTRAGHCLGVGLAVQKLVAGKVRYRRFGATATSAFQLGTRADGPGDALGSYLDAQQVSQASDEFISAYFHRPRSLQPQLDTLATELSHNREPMINIFSGTAGHAVLAYDMEQTAAGTDIYVYENEVPFVETEEGDAALHKSQMELSVIHIDAAKQTWSLPIGAGETFSGGNDGSFWVLPQGTIPDDPSLPGLGTLKTAFAGILFGSSDGAVRTVGDAGVDAFLPFMLGLGQPGSAGTWISRDRNRPLAVTFRGTRSGTYSQAYTAPGFVAAADVRTAKGVTDRVRGEGDSLSFQSGIDRPLKVDLAREAGAVTTSATLRTRASAGGDDSAGLSRGALSYSHDGAPTSVSFTLNTVNPAGGASSFASGPIAIGRGAHLSARAIGRGLDRVRLTVRDARGGRRTRVLRSHASRGQVKLGAPKGSRGRLTVPVRLAGLERGAVAGATLRLMRGHRVLAHRAMTLTGKGSHRRIVWKLPGSVRAGSYRLLVDVHALSSGGRGSAAIATAAAHRAATVRIEPR